MPTVFKIRAQQASPAPAPLTRRLQSGSEAVPLTHIGRLVLQPFSIAVSIGILRRTPSLSDLEQPKCTACTLAIRSADRCALILGGPIGHTLCGPVRRSVYT